MIHKNVFIESNFILLKHYWHFLSWEKLNNLMRNCSKYFETSANIRLSKSNICYVIFNPPEEVKKQNMSAKLINMLQ